MHMKTVKRCIKHIFFVMYGDCVGELCVRCLWAYTVHLFFNNLKSHKICVNEFSVNIFRKTNF